VFEVSLCAAIAMAAFVFCWQCGKRGFFPLDQSIVYDGAWRVFLGQCPYRDFVSPIGPISFFYQSFLFRILGPGFRAYLFGGALLNALSAGMVFILVRVVAGASGARRFSSLWLASGSACVSAVWFQSQMGTTYPDQVSMFLCLASLFLAVSGASLLVGPGNRRKRILAFAGAGFAMGMAFAAKQNFAAFFAPVLLVAWFLGLERSERWRGALWFFAGLGAFLVLSLIWLLAVADTRLFFKYFFAVPVSEGLRRLSGGGKTGGGGFHFLWSVAIPLAAVCAVSAWRLAERWRRGGGLRGLSAAGFGDAAFPAALALVLAFYGVVMVATTNNNPENAWSLLGLVCGLGLLGLAPGKDGASEGGVGRRASAQARNKRSRGSDTFSNRLFLVSAAVFAVAVWGGAVSAWERRAQDLRPPLSFHALSFPPTMPPLLWCDRTPVGSVGGRCVVLPGRDVERLCRVMAGFRGNVFVFSDFTALYGFTGKVPPQPLLWFHDGLTYRRGGDPELDAWIVSELERNKVGMVVFEEVSWFGSYVTLNKFPKLREYIDGKFVVVARFGIYQIRVRREPLEKSSE